MKLPHPTLREILAIAIILFVWSAGIFALIDSNKHPEASKTETNNLEIIKYKIMRDDDGAPIIAAKIHNKGTNKTSIGIIYLFPNNDNF